MNINQLKSPLIDPLILESPLANPNNNNVNLNILKKKISKVNWVNVLINYVLPIFIFLFTAFQLKNNYDKKKNLHNEYLVL